MAKLDEQSSEVKTKKSKNDRWHYIFTAFNRSGCNGIPAFVHGIKFFYDKEPDSFCKL